MTTGKAVVSSQKPLKHTPTSPTRTAT